MSETAIKILKDARYDHTITNRYELALSIVHNRCASVVFDSFENRFVCYYEKTLSNTLQEQKQEIASFIAEQFKNTSFKKVTLLYSTYKTTLVPEAVFDNKYIETYFNYNHQTEQDDCIEKAFIRNGNVYQIFTIPQWVKNIFTQQFPQCRIAAHSLPIIDSILLLNKNKKSSCKLYVNIEDDFFDIIVIQDGLLQLFNSFCYSNGKDFIYNIMNIYEQLKLNQESNSLTFMGRITIDSELITLSKQFIRNLHFISFRDEIQRFSYVFDEISPIHIVSLINTFSCE